ncbi:TolC family protein [Candidatus Magnetobacterium casensis]|uniref:TolC family protein n=1 Tax=Candidatus Magnetobacterium casense TaxID=1455061 RepID=A0ABS6RTX0_9BACT|nr:TolC family protein [Candidatus Magnetobacterium casensis]
MLCYGAEIEVTDVSKDTLTITEGLAIATERGRIINIASHNVGIAASESDIAQAAMRPSVDAAAGHSSLYYQPGAIFNNNTVNTANKSSFFYGITVKQTIYDFGARLSRYNESLAAIDKAMIDVDRTRNVVALNYLLVCFELLETDRLIYVALREVEQLTAHRDVTQSLYNAGVVTRNDSLAADVKLADARQRLLSLKNLRTLNASRLNYFLTRAINDAVMLIDDSPPPHRPFNPLRCTYATPAVSGANSGWQTGKYRCSNCNPPQRRLRTIRGSTSGADLTTPKTATRCMRATGRLSWGPS